MLVAEAHKLSARVAYESPCCPSRPARLMKRYMAPLLPSIFKHIRQYSILDYHNIQLFHHTQHFSSPESLIYTMSDDQKRADKAAVTLGLTDSATAKILQDAGESSRRKRAAALARREREEAKKKESDMGSVTIASTG